MTACQPATVTEPPIIETSTALPEKQIDISIAGGARDVWSWTEPVRVKVSEPDQCKGVVVYVNGQEFESQPEGDSFTAEVQLKGGDNQIDAACILPGGGEVRSDAIIHTLRLRQVPTAMINIALADDQFLLDGSSSRPAEVTQAAIVDYEWSAREGNPAPLPELASEVKGQSISIASPTTDGEYYVNLTVKDQDGHEDTSTIYFVVEEGKPRIPDYDTENPVWTEEAIVYGVVPFLFGSPAFNAITEQLDDLADLGINTLWLGPINQHPADDYGYAVEDYFKLDPAYGTEEEFRRLVDEAHARGIRVIMDFVPNHTSNTHPYFLDAQERGPESPYWDFYDRDEQGNYTHYFNWTHLPNLNYDNPEVRQMMSEAFEYWVREFDVDGFRVDVVWGVKERYPEYWPEWRRELKRIKPDLLLLAEASARDPFYFDNGFDAAYDWTYSPGTWAWDVIWDAYKYRLLSYNLTDALTNPPEGFHPDALIFRFLNNNDTGRRFITRHGEGVTRVATALLMTLPGVPNIYTGDEYGLEFEPYQQVEPLVFEEQVPGLRDYHKKLIDLRKSMSSLRSRDMSILKLDAVPQTVYGYVRYGGPSDPPVLVLLNFSEEPATFEFDLPQEVSTLAQDTLYDFLSEESIPAMEGGRMKVSVPGLTARVLAQEPVE